MVNLVFFGLVEVIVFFLRFLFYVGLVYSWCLLRVGFFKVKYYIFNYKEKVMLEVSIFFFISRGVCLGLKGFLLFLMMGEFIIILFVVFFFFGISVMELIGFSFMGLILF